MLTIRNEQIQALAQPQKEKYIDGLCDFLRTEFPDAAGMEYGMFRQGVSDQVDKAQKYGLLIDRQINVYVVTAWMLGEAFDSEMPPAKFVLNSDDYTPDEKTEWLENWTTQIFEDLDKV